MRSIVLAALLLTATTLRAAEPTPAEVFEKRIAPIFKSPNPSSCVQCHLAGVDLKDYILPDAEKTFRSLRDQGLIDLAAPEKSKIVKLIDMGGAADAKPNAVHAKTRKMERDAGILNVVALVTPLRRKRLHQPRQRRRGRLPPVQNRLHDLRRQQRQPQNPAAIGFIDPLPRRDHPHRRDGTNFQHAPPAEAPRQRLDHGIIDPGTPGRPGRVTVRRDHLFSPPALAGSHRHTDGHRLGRGGHYAACLTNLNDIDSVFRLRPPANRAARWVRERLPWNMPGIRNRLDQREAA